MANLVTTDDLKSYALWLSGEPTDGTSDYDERVLQHMQLCYNTLTAGGTLGTRDIATAAGLYEHVVDIPTTNWRWLRKQPPFAFVTTPAIIGSAAGVTVNQGTVIGTVALTYGSDQAVFSIAPAVSVTGWRLKLLQQAEGVGTPPMTVPRISEHTAGAFTATLDTTWNQETQTVSTFVLFQTEYPLPADFVRFCESPSIQGGAWTNDSNGHLAVGDYEQMCDNYPLTEFNQGPPSAGARLNTGVLMMNRWDTFSYRIEFAYTMEPPVLEVAATPDLQEPLVPLRFRQVLSLGAAMLVTADKVDSRTGSLASQFREILERMGLEYRSDQNAGSELAGRMLYRGSGRRRGLLRTTSGLCLW